MPFPSPHLNQHIKILCFVLFVSLKFLRFCALSLAVAELWTDLFAPDIFSGCVSGCQSPFHPAHKCIAQSVAKQKHEEGQYIPQDGQLFHLHEKEYQCFKKVPWEEKPCLCPPGYREEHKAGGQAMPHLEAILPSKDSLCNVMFLTTIKISPCPHQWTCGPTPLFTYGMLWCYVTQSILEMEDKRLRASSSCLLPLQHVSFSSRQSTEG